MKMNKVGEFVKRHKILVAFFVVVLAVVSWWNYEFPSATWRYKLIVEIETPEGVKSGYSVQEVSNSTPLINFPDTGKPARVRGEAVVVDLGSRGIVFALMSDQSWANPLYQAFPTEAPSSKKGIKYYNDTLKLGMKAELKKYLPQMVMFKDIKDPKTVTLVKGGRFDVKTQGFVPVDDFESIFGQGVKPKAVTVEITDEPVTWEIKKRLGWLPQLGGGYLNGKHVNGPNLYEQLHTGNFIKGYKEGE